MYLYLKSEDQQWYRKDYHGTQSVHWSECCKHPWMSMTIKSNGEACMCMEDFDNEIVLGDARTPEPRRDLERRCVSQASARTTSTSPAASSAASGAT